MARKHVVASHKMIDSGDMSASFNSTETDVKNLDSASIRVTWDIGGNPVGTLKIQALQKKDTEQSEDADWFDVDFDATVTIDNTETEHQILFEILPFDKIRLRYERSSGTGTMNARITAKTTGA